jgi:hypothetical protein
MTTKYILKNIPSGWSRQSARGKGWKLVDENGVERVRFMRPDANSSAPWNSVKGGYWRRQNESGQYFNINGDVVDPNLRITDIDAFQRATHIPYNGVS